LWVRLSRSNLGRTSRPVANRYGTHRQVYQTSSDTLSAESSLVGLTKPDTGKLSQLFSLWSFLRSQSRSEPNRVRTLCRCRVAAPARAQKGYHSHELASVVRVVPRLLKKVGQGVLDVSVLVKHVPPAPWRADKRDVMVMGVLRPEQRYPTWATHRDLAQRQLYPSSWRWSRPSSRCVLGELRWLRVSHWGKKVLVVDAFVD
jgi:hypothetical protein